MSLKFFVTATFALAVAKPLPEYQKKSSPDCSETACGTGAIDLRNFEQGDPFILSDDPFRKDFDEEDVNTQNPNPLTNVNKIMISINVNKMNSHSENSETKYKRVGPSPDSQNFPDETYSKHKFQGVFADQEENFSQNSNDGMSYHTTESHKAVLWRKLEEHRDKNRKKVAHFIQKIEDHHEQVRDLHRKKVNLILDHLLEKL